MDIARLKTKHTPGPWTQHDPDYCPDEIWGNLEGPLEDGRIHGTHVCTVTLRAANPEDDVPEAEMHANAKLIAAAPELLAALERLVQCTIDDNSLERASFGGTVMGQCVAAIRKAKGGA